MKEWYLKVMLINNLQYDLIFEIIILYKKFINVNEKYNFLGKEILSN